MQHRFNKGKIFKMSCLNLNGVSSEFQRVIDNDCSRGTRVTLFLEMILLKRFS